MYQHTTVAFADALPHTLQLGVVVPTLNEQANVPVLLARLRRALAGIEWEIIFVDDGSIDGTREMLLDEALRDPRVRVIRRAGRRGLASAVLEGMLCSAAPVLAVIDADLQHDEGILPGLFSAVHERRADIAIGTRYDGCGSTGDWEPGRARISRFATRLAAAILPINVSDPMSGFFAMSREALDDALPRLSVVGYKILLDVITSSPTRPRICEIPYHFRSRIEGDSKLDSAIAVEYGQLLLDKTIGRWIPLRFLMFAGVGGFGLIVHLGLLALSLQLGLTFRVAQAAAVITAMTINFILNNRFTYRDRRLVGFAFWRGLASFHLVCGVGALANVGIGAVIYSADHRWWLAGAAGAIVGALWNYVATSCLTWRQA